MKKQQTITALPIKAISSTLLPTAQMPFALDIEQAVLGCIMIDRSAAVQQSLLQLTPDSFYDGCTRTVFETMRVVENSGSQIDIHTVGEQLKQDNNLAAIGGINYLVDLTQKVGSGAHFETHVKILLERQIGRQLAAAGYRTMCRALDGLDVADVLDQVQGDIEQITTVGLSNSNHQHISLITETAVSQAHIRQQKYEKGEINGIPTGLAELDKLTGGWQPSQLIILAARPAMGKTALMLHFAISAAKAGIASCIYSVEMSAVSLIDRMMLSQCSIASENYRRGRLSNSEWMAIDDAKAKLDALPITVDDKAGVSMRYIAIHSKIMQRRGKCSLVLVDYLQLLDMRTPEKGRNREQEVANASKAAKELAKELGIVVIMLAQLSRAVEGRGGNKEPMLSDLRESGAIEQDADIVMFPHRPQYYTDKPYADVMLPGGRIVHDMPLAGLGKLIVAKQRDGATGTVMFNCNLSQCRFWDFDERQYLAPASVGYSSGGCVGDRPVSSGSINYVAPTPPTPPDDLPF